MHEKGIVRLQLELLQLPSHGFFSDLELLQQDFSTLLFCWESMFNSQHVFFDEVFSEELHP
jgi:hypothetical protein